MAKSGWGFVGLVVACVACGTTGPSDMNGTDDASGGAASGGAPASGGATGSGGAGSGGGATGGGDATGGDGSGGQTVQPSELFPLALGNRWTYDVLEMQDAFCDLAYAREEVYATRELGGVAAFILNYPCLERDPEGDAPMAAVDGEIVQWLDEAWHVTLPAPLAEGATWSVPSAGVLYEYTWHFTGEVTVPAGTFQDCWTRRMTPLEIGSYVNIYCPGVGPVRRESPEVTLELASYELK